MIRTVRPSHRSTTYRIGSAVLRAVVLCVALLGNGLARAQTKAGTPIVNTAGLTYDTAGQTRALQSNTVTVLVAERLDVQLVREGEGPVPLTASNVAVPFVLTNADNGDESFAITATLASGGAGPLLAIDSDGDGRYDPAHDAMLVGGKTPLLAPGTTLRLFAIVGGGAEARTDDLVVTARSTTGSGTTGSPYDGKGDNGSDAVVGPTGATASVTVPLRAGAAAAPELVKRQSVLGTDGGTTPGRGAIITYTLEARFPDGASAAVIADLIPDGTSFVSGSLRIDDIPLTDGADADAGRFDGRGIAVALGDVPAAATRTVQFKTQIQ